jgi:hypothetical protein
VTNTPDTRRCVLSVMTTVFGGASLCTRAATLVVRPLPLNQPSSSSTTTGPVWMPTRTATSSPISSRKRVFTSDSPATIDNPARTARSPAFSNATG